MEVDPHALAHASRDWDEQHLDLQAAARQVAGAETGGFTGQVAGAARRFTAAWQRHAAALATDAEARADRLRGVLADYLATDGAVAGDARVLAGLLPEVR